MRKRFLAGALSAVAAVFLLGASSASASTEFGSNCGSNAGAGSVSLLSQAHGAGSPLPVTAPITGVITRWKTTTTIPIPPEAISLYAQQLQVMRPTGVPKQFIKVGESSSALINLGVNSFPARIPVQAGDYLGLAGSFVTLYCSTGDPADVMGVQETPGVLPVGGAALYSPAPGTQVPAAAIIEPDVDKDNYGDETQDGCPQSAAYQTPCPVITINALTQTGAKSVTVLVATSLGAPVQITGSAKLGKGATANLKATTVGVVPGVIGKVQLQFPSSLKKRLKELKPKQKLTLKVTASAANIAGAASTTTVSTKLKGQGK